MTGFMRRRLGYTSPREPRGSERQAVPENDSEANTHADPTDAEGEQEPDGSDLGWPQLSQLDLDVCLATGSSRPAGDRLSEG